MSALPAHVVELLIVQGKMFEDGASRKARVGRCKSCRGYIARGLDHDRTAMLVTVDLDPLSRIGEAQALLAGLFTASLSLDAGRYLIDPRTVLNIRAHPAGELSYADVVAEHRCGAGPFASAPSRIPVRVRAKDVEVCPF